MTAPVTRAVPAMLEAATETETDFGGRVRVWAPVATAWVTLTPGGASQSVAEGQRPVRVQTASASARDHPLAAAGQRLTCAGDAPWSVLEVRRTTPGAMTLLLERTA